MTIEKGGQEVKQHRKVHNRIKTEDKRRNKSLKFIY